MDKAKQKKRGGSDTARELGLVGAVVHFTPAEMDELRKAAQRKDLALKHWMQQALLGTAKKENSENSSPESLTSQDQLGTV